MRRLRSTDVPPCERLSDFVDVCVQKAFSAEPVSAAGPSSPRLSIENARILLDIAIYFPVKKSRSVLRAVVYISINTFLYSVPSPSQPDATLSRVRGNAYRRGREREVSPGDGTSQGSL